jgi:antitoxin ParD1/3/4
MNIAISERWEKFVEDTVEKGRYASATDVVQEGLRLVAEREARLQALREMIAESIAAGGDVGDEELDADLDAMTEALRKEGIA